MNSTRRPAVLALASAGVLWGSSMPLSKLSLGWLEPGWLTVVRFGLAALLLAVPARAHLRAAVTPEIVLWGVFGVGLCVVVQNVGVGLTSVSHASMMVGAIPVLVALIAAVWHRSRISSRAWAGLLVSLVGVAVVAGGGGGQSSAYGDGLVLFSLAISAAMTVAQVRMLDGRDPMAVTAVQFVAGAVAALPIAILSEGAPPAAPSAVPVLGVLALSVVGTLLPWVLFAYGQARVSAVVAGSFINIEPLVGAGAAALFFGEAITIAQIGAGLAILTGVAISTLATAPSTAAEAEASVEGGLLVPGQVPTELEPVPSLVSESSQAPSAPRRIPRIPLQRRPLRAVWVTPAFAAPGGRSARDAWAFDDISADDLILDRWGTAA
ncbi:MAG: DMT family transporter [Actinomycetota bacterium]|nr:DMT family transporter [Actinomycetota bacterium]